MKGNNSHLKTFFSGSLISIVGVGITGVLNYFIRRTLFMNMSEADYGTFYSAVAFLLMVGGFAELGLSQTGALLIAENNTGSQKTRKISSCFSSLLSLKLILATVVLILLLSCSRWILKDYLRTGNGLFYYLLAGMLFFQILECTFYPLFSGLKDFVSYNFLQVTKALLLLSGIALFSRSGQLPAAAAVFFSVAILIVFIAGAIAFFREKIRLSWHPDRAVWTRLFQLSGFIAVSTTLLNMIYYMDTVMLTAIKGVTSSALYNVALPIMQIVQAAMVFPLSSVPAKPPLPFSTASPIPAGSRVFAHSTPATMFLASANMPAKTSSFTALALAPGVLKTTIPCWLHFSIGILLTPAPALAIASSCSGSSMSCIAAERTRTASA